MGCIDDKDIVEDLVFFLRHNPTLKQVELRGKASLLVLKKLIEGLLYNILIETLDIKLLQIDKTELLRVVESFKSLRPSNLHRLSLTTWKETMSYAVLHGMGSIEELDIKFVDEDIKFVDKTLEAFVSFLSFSQSLDKLSVQANDNMLTVLLPHLAFGFVFNQSIQELCLSSHDEVDRIAYLHLASILDHGTGLKSLKMENTLIFPRELARLLGAVGLHPLIVWLNLEWLPSGGRMWSQAMFDSLRPRGGHLSELVLPNRDVLYELNEDADTSILADIPPDAFESVQGTTLTKLCFGKESCLSLEQADAVIRSVSNGPLSSLRYMDMVVDKRFVAHLERTMENLAACLADNPVLEEYCRFLCYANIGVRMEVIFAKGQGLHSAVRMAHWAEAEDKEECARTILERLNLSGVFCLRFEPSGTAVSLDIIP